MRKRDKDRPKRSTSARAKLAAVGVKFIALNLLQEKNSTAWKQLPKKVREWAEKVGRRTERLLEIHDTIERLPPAGKKMMKKLLAAARAHPDSEWSHLPIEYDIETIRILTKKGRVRSRETQAKIRLAAQCSASGMTEYQMAKRLYPDSSVLQTVKYSRTRAFCKKHKQEILDEVLRVKVPRAIA